jgi:hypothetical protein
MEKMKNHEREYFCCQNKEGNLVGIDRKSGGYPLAFDDMIIGVCFWPDRKLAQNYADVVGLTVVKIKLIVEKV